MPLPRRLGFLLAAFVVATACSDTTLPDSTETWVMLTANGAAAPALVSDVTYSDDGERLQIYALSDTIRITGGRWEQQANFAVHSNGTFLQNRRITDHGVVSQAGTTRIFESDLYQNVGFSAALTPSGAMLVDQDAAQEGVVARYDMRRVGQ